MKHIFLLLGLSVLMSCSKVADGFIFSWGDTDVRYEQCSAPEALADQAFRYPAWKGEKVFAEAVIWSPEDVEGLKVSVSQLKGKGGVIPASASSARFVRYVWADHFIEGYRQCGHRLKGQFDSLMVADMVDLEALADVEAGNCQQVWVTVDVPADAVPGIYEGSLMLKGKGMAAMKLPVSLEVTDRVLPEPKDWKFHLDLWQNPYSVARVEGVELWSEEHFEKMRPVMQMLADAGQKVITATILDRPWNSQTEDPYGSMVTKTLKKDGSWEYGYEVFDKWVEFMMSLGIDKQINCYSLIPWKLQFDYLDEATGQMTTINAAPGTNEYRIYWMTFIADFAQHLREKGWFEKTMIAMDERPAEAMKAAFDVIYSAEPDFKVSLAGGWHPEIESDIDDYCVAFRTPMPDDVIKARREQGKVSTYYTCCAERYPNIFTVSPLAEAVWIPWHALAKDYDGYLRWAYNHWTAEPMKDTRFRTWTSGDCYCVYPQGRTSLRFDKLLEGIQDYEKVCILRDEWVAAGDTARLEALDKVLAAFDFETIKAEGAAPAVHNAKALILPLSQAQRVY